MAGAVAPGWKEWIADMIRFRDETSAICLCFAAFVTMSVVCTGTAEVPDQATPTGNATGLYDRSTPDRLLQFYIEAHERKDIEMYQQALHEHYVFVLEPHSVERMGMPRVLSRAGDIRAQDRMFGEPWIESIAIRMLPLTNW
jgi:hypothetical protein